MALAVLRLSGQERVVASQPVLRAAEWQALSAAEDVLACAQASVKRARADAAEQAAEAARQAVQQQASVRERQQQQALLLKALSLQVEFERLQRELRQQVVDTVMSSLRAMLAGPLPSAFFQQAVASAQFWGGQDGKVVLRVASSDEPAARVALAAGAGPVRLQVDPDLAPGQCFLDTDFGRLQASLETQLQALHEALQRWWRPSDAGAAAEDKARATGGAIAAAESSGMAAAGEEGPTT